MPLSNEQETLSTKLREGVRRAEMDTEAMTHIVADPNNTSNHIV